MCKDRKQNKRGNRPQDNLTDTCRQNTVRGPKFTVKVWCLILVAVTSYTTGSAQGNNARLDANALVHQMVAAYRSFQTLQENSETKFVKTNGAEFIQTTTIKYERPNLVYVEAHDPMQGSVLMYCNGRSAVIYSGKQNIYMQRTAAPTIVGSLEVMSKASKVMIGLPQDQMLSPLSFLAAKRMPVEAANFRYVKTEVIAGKRVALVAAVAELNWLKALFPVSVPVTFQKREIMLWIDLNTRLLVRASCDFIWIIEAGNNPEPGRMRFVETHYNVIPNAPLREEDFNIIPPKGAQEVFSTAR